MSGDLKPGDVTTLGALRPGDVARYLVNDDEPGTEFVVGGRRGTAVYVQYPSPANNHYGDDDSPMVRYLGRGRIEPAKIVIEGESDRVAELEEQVRALQKLVKPKSDIPCCVKCGRWMSEHWDFPDRCEGFVIPETIELTIAATAPKEKP